MMIDLATLASSESEEGKKIKNTQFKQIIKDIFKTEQRPERAISLDFEHQLSLDALKGTNTAFKKSVHKLKPHQGQINSANNSSITFLSILPQSAQTYFNQCVYYIWNEFPNHALWL